jgi:hypothetical protein
MDGLAIVMLVLASLSAWGLAGCFLAARASERELAENVGEIVCFPFRR